MLLKTKKAATIEFVLRYLQLFGAFCGKWRHGDLSGVINHCYNWVLTCSRLEHAVFAVPALFGLLRHPLYLIFGPCLSCDLFFLPNLCRYQLKAFHTLAFILPLYLPWIDVYSCLFKCWMWFCISNDDFQVVDDFSEFRSLKIKTILIRPKIRPLSLCVELEDSEKRSSRGRSFTCADRKRVSG